MLLEQVVRVTKANKSQYNDSGMYEGPVPTMYILGKGAYRNV